MNLDKTAAIGWGAAAITVVGMIVIGASPLVSGIWTAVVACLGYVAFAAQSRRFDEHRQLVYRPVYVRARNVHGRFSQFRD